MANALAELDAADVALYSDQQAIDGTTPIGRAMIQMASVFGEQERQRISAGWLYLLGYFGGDIDVAIGFIDRGIKLNPNAAMGWQWSAWLRLWSSHPDEAFMHFETSLRLNPHQNRANPFMGMGVGHFFAGRLDEARKVLLQSLQE